MDDGVYILLAALVSVAGLLAIVFYLTRREAAVEEDLTHRSNKTEQVLLHKAAAQRKEAIQRSFPVKPSGTTLDTSAVTPRIRQVRTDYLAELHSRPHRARQQQSLVAVAREAVRNLPFFRRQTADEAPSLDSGEQAHTN